LALSFGTRLDWGDKVVPWRIAARDSNHFRSSASTSCDVECAQTPWAVI
jgi:hypothetical protein